MLGKICEMAEEFFSGAGEKFQVAWTSCIFDFTEDKFRREK